MFSLILGVALAASCEDKIYAFKKPDGVTLFVYNYIPNDDWKQVDEDALVNCKEDARIIKLQGDKYVLDSVKKAAADLEDAAILADENAKKALIQKAKAKTLTKEESDELLKILSERL